MKSLTGKFASSGGWALLLILLLGAGLFVAACGDEDVPTPTTPAPPPPPPPAPPPAPEPEPEPEPEAPAVPVGLRISDSGTDFVEWSWTPVADVSGYDVQFSPNEAFTGEDEIIARTAEEISYRRDGLAEATSAFLRVRSAAGTGEERITSDWSTHVTGMTEAPTPEPAPEPPAMPTGLAVSDSGEDFIEWSWDPVEGAAGYDVQFSENQIFSEEDETISRSVEQVSYRREELETGTSYYLRVRSAAGTGEERITSDWSTHVTGMTEAPTPVLQPPAMPTGLAVSDRGENFIEWSWDPADGASGYDVQFSENQVFSEEDETISRTLEEISYRREELEAETSYYLRVRSAAGTGEERITSGWSTHVTGTTTAAEPDAPPAPANLRVKDTGSDFIVWEWDDVPGASGYQAQFSTDSAFSDSDTFHLLPGASNTSHRVSNLESVADGYLRVRAYLGTLANPVYGEWSEAKKATTDEPPAVVAVALDAPDNVEPSNPLDNSITVTWDAVNDAEEYEVQQREDGGGWVDANCGSATGSNVVTGTSCVASGLDEDTEYDFRVKAFPDSSDSTKTESGWSGTASATTTGEAPAPPITGGSNDINLAWSSDEDGISWDWDPVADRAQRGRIENYVALLTAPAQSCPALTEAEAETLAATVPQPDANPNRGTWLNGESDISAELTTITDAGEIRGLCVVRSWEDDRKVRQFGDVSLAWASTVPAFDVGGATPPEVRNNADTRLTTSIGWDYQVDEGFTYELRIRSADRDDGLSAGCGGGTSVRSPTASTTNNVDLTHRETSLDPYSDYRLCVRATNDDGASAWQGVGDATTRPTAPSALRSGDSQTTTDDWGGQRATRLVWTVAEKAGTPRDADMYEATGFRTTDNIASGDLQDRCSATPTTELEITPSNTGMGIALTTMDADLNTANAPPAQYHFYACLRADPDDDGDEGAWAVAKQSYVDGQPTATVGNINQGTRTASAITWTWERLEDANGGYEVIFAEDGNDAITEDTAGVIRRSVSQTSNPTTRFTGLKADTEYAVRIRYRQTVSGRRLVSDWGTKTTARTTAQ